MLWMIGTGGQVLGDGRSIGGLGGMAAAVEVDTTGLADTTGLEGVILALEGVILALAVVVLGLEVLVLLLAVGVLGLVVGVLGLEVAVGKYVSKFLRSTSSGN